MLILDKRKLSSGLHYYWQDAHAAIGGAGRFVLAVLRTARVMLCGVLGMVARHGVCGHAHSLGVHRLMGMRYLHRTSVHNERKRKDEGKQSFMQPDMHDESKAKTRANVYWIACRGAARHQSRLEIAC